jgi:acetyltransferase-like isoleucine patch superfamily enzyme
MKFLLVLEMQASPAARIPWCTPTHGPHPAGLTIAPAVTIWTTEHGFEGPAPIQDQPMTFHPVAIGNDVWIGVRAIILGGATLPDGTIVGAGSVVTKAFAEPYTTIAGVPAKIIRQRR